MDVELVGERTATLFLARQCLLHRSREIKNQRGKVKKDDVGFRLQMPLDLLCQAHGIRETFLKGKFHPSLETFDHVFILVVSKSGVIFSNHSLGVSLLGRLHAATVSFFETFFTLSWEIRFTKKNRIILECTHFENVFREVFCIHWESSEKTRSFKIEKTW